MAGKAKAAGVGAEKTSMRGTWRQEVAMKALGSGAGSWSLSLPLGAGKIMELHQRPFPNRRMQTLLFLWSNHLSTELQDGAVRSWIPQEMLCHRGAMAGNGSTEAGRPAGQVPVLHYALGPKLADHRH